MNAFMRTAAFLLAGALLLPAGLRAANENIAIVLTAKGNAEIKKVDADWTKAKMGLTLDDGDQVRTGQTGFLALVFVDDKSQLKIRPGTQFTLNGVREGDDSIAKRVNMEIGELFAEVQQQKGSLQVATPTSVASVKGTQFWVLLEENGETTLLTMEGIVEFLNLISGESLDVGDGLGAVSSPEGDITFVEVDPGMVPELFEDEQDLRRIELQFQDENGDVKTLIIEYSEESEE